jgi:hypothetical protein
MKRADRVRVKSSQSMGCCASLGGGNRGGDNGASTGCLGGGVTGIEGSRSSWAIVGNVGTAKWRLGWKGEGIGGVRIEDLGCLHIDQLRSSDGRDGRVVCIA